jgi:predicted RNA-binding Zn-ribbon protein involved in translation (DUF1610 family)
MEPTENTRQATADNTLAECPACGIESTEAARGSGVVLICQKCGFVSEH